jgi:hypothetical protein
MGYLNIGSPETGVCIRNVESMHCLFRIFGISDIEIDFLLEPNDVLVVVIIKFFDVMDDRNG